MVGARWVCIVVPARDRHLYAVSGARRPPTARLQDAAPSPPVGVARASLGVHGGYGAAAAPLMPVARGGADGRNFSPLLS